MMVAVLDDGGLAEPQHRLGTACVKPERGVLLQRGMRAADRVDLCDQLLQMPRLVPVARLDLVFLRVEVFLRTGPYGHVLAQLESAVDAVARAERGGENQPRLERRSAAMLQELVQDVGCVGEQVRTEVFGYLGTSQLGQVVAKLGGAVAPGEIGVRLRKSGLRQMTHHRRTRERLGEEDGVGVFPLDVRDAPLPEPERLRVRIVDPENLHAVGDPEQEDITQGDPERRSVAALEIERVDVLVFLRWILRVLDRSVGTMPEPLRVLADPRMIGRGLESDVERDVEAEVGRGIDESIEVLQRAESR